MYSQQAKNLNLENLSFSGDEDFPRNSSFKFYESSFREKERKVPGIPSFFDQHHQLNDLAKDSGNQNSLAPISSYNLQQQELIIIEDLFSILLGFQGNYLTIKKSNSSRNSQCYSVEYPSDTDKSLSERFLRIAKIAENYFLIREFIVLYSGPNAGQVNQALSAALKTLEKEYMDQIIILEHAFRTATSFQPFTLQTFWCNLASRALIIDRLALLVNTIYKESKNVQIQMRLRDQELGLVTSVDADDEEPTDSDTDSQKVSDFSESSYDSDSYDSDHPSDVSSDDINHSNHSLNESIDPNQNNSAKYKKSRRSKRKKKFRGNYKVVSVRGGYTLNIIALAIKDSSGDQVSNDIYSFLLNQAAVPFLNLLSKWLHFGTIESKTNFEADQKEFMISRSEGQVPAAIAGTEEVIVIDNPDFKKSSSNVIRFTLDADLTPEFLRPWSKKILLTGKYINVVLECKANMDEHSVQQTVVKSSDNQSHVLEINPLMRALNGKLIVKEIEDAYNNANSALLAVLFEKRYLPGYLDAAKRYYLLDRADFLANFFDMAGADLEKYPTSELFNHLNLLLEQTLKNPASTIYFDNYKEEISLGFATEKLIESLKLLQLNEVKPRNFQSRQMTNLPFEIANQQPDSNRNSLSSNSSSGDSLACSKFFCLQLEVKFPASLVLNAISVRKYTLLHRYILSLKYLEWRLSSAWLLHSKLYFEITSSSTSRRGKQKKDIGGNQEKSELGDKGFNTETMRKKTHLLLFTLRNKMLVCTQQILHYLFYEIIEPNWKNLLDSIASSKTVDGVITAHNQFLDSSLLQCGLTNPKLFKNLNRLISMCSYLVKNTAYVCDSKSFFNTGVLSKEALDSSIPGVGVKSDTTNQKLNLNSSLENPLNAGASTNSHAGNARVESNSKNESSISRSSTAGLGTVQYADNFTGVNKQIGDTLKMLQHISNSFSSSLTIIMEALNHYAQNQSPKYLNLAARLDFIKTRNV
ncbi:hypothetical protein BB560_002451 [Smittium megazygosporum]|uniref:Spindle pole body component n=1 Tax=Smittium megazygosporum TaxID=133381 RepID=A0A2T9ZET6_9FUNG|nr:hypothetical protein BB560_002451 [Smittium megazygosporum]